MKIHISGTPKPVDEGDFQYGNIESSYRANTQYFTRDGQPFFPISGEVHYSRLPAERWRETLLKMRACGVNIAATYVFWNHHEKKDRQFNFDGNLDIAAFLRLCQALSMPCVLRIGPWCHGEALYGGLPPRIQRMPGKRTDDECYLTQVRLFWQALYRQVRPFLDGKTIIGLQLENEYTGSTEHLRTLRRLAEQIGFRVPFFTMTAWPSGKPDREFLPMFGGYPDAPWSGGKKALKPNGRFAISPVKTEEEIGSDLLRRAKGSPSDVFDQTPYAFCEIGPGNQVTQHRRPRIGEKDGYGVGFAKLASGANWLGYYMFCGGANPIGRLLQESRLTGYPNNYPILDYDFQAPVSRWGEIRPHGHRLRLLHLFLTSFDPEFPKKQVYFPSCGNAAPTDVSHPQCSVRATADGSGYLFLSAFERGLEYPDFPSFSVDFTLSGKTVSLPPVDVKSGAQFFFPFHLRLGSVLFDYILAQPIAKRTEGNKTVCYFAACEGVAPKCAVGGRENLLSFGHSGNEFGDVVIVLLTMAQAKTFYLLGGQVYFSDTGIYESNGTIVREHQTELPLSLFSLRRIKPRRLPLNYFLYSRERRAYYELRLPENILQSHRDIVLEFTFDGLNLQVFSGKTLINDFFNIDRRFVLHLRDWRAYWQKDPVLILRTAPLTRCGVSHVYHEVPIPLYSNALTLKRAYAIDVKEEAHAAIGFDDSAE